MIKKIFCYILLYILLFIISIKIFSNEESISFSIDKNIKEFIDQTKNIEWEYYNNNPVNLIISRNISGVNEYTDLYLSFDNDKISDETGNYKFSYKKMLTSNDKSIYKSSAFFINNTHYLELIGNKNSFFQSGVILSSFTIKFYIYTINYNNNEIILKIGSQYYNRKEDIVEDQSIIAKLDNGYLIWEFNNLFYLNNIKIPQLKLDSYNRIVPNRWTQVIFSYDCYTGIIKQTFDQDENGILIATIDGKKDSSKLNMMFNKSNKCLIKIAPSFSGGLDEFYIIKKQENFDKDKFSEDGGEILSKVIDLGKGGVQIKRVITDDVKLNNSDILYYYRFSDKPFYPVDEYSSDVKWNLLRNNELNYKFARFIQWKIVLLAGDNNQYSPKFKGLTLIYDKNVLPSRPVGVKIIEDDGVVKIKWIKNSEKDIKGYKIYYGTKMQTYFGTDADQGVSPIVIGPDDDFYNKGIEITGLKPNTIYYFAVTSFDDNEGNNESDFSEEVTARPIEKYLIPKTINSNDFSVKILNKINIQEYKDFLLSLYKFDYTNGLYVLKEKISGFEKNNLKKILKSINF